MYVLYDRTRNEEQRIDGKMNDDVVIVICHINWICFLVSNCGRIMQCAHISKGSD